MWVGVVRRAAGRTQAVHVLSNMMPTPDTYLLNIYIYNIYREGERERKRGLG